MLSVSRQRDAAADYTGISARSMRDDSRSDCVARIGRRRKNYDTSGILMILMGRYITTGYASDLE